MLAAGGGSRWSGPGHKLLAPFRGRTVVGWAVAHALDAGLDATFVVSGAVPLDGVVPAGATLIDNPDWARGQSGSLQVAIGAAAAAGAEAIVVGLGDQPMIGPDAWRAVAACSSHPIVVATYDGRRRNPVRLASSVWPLVSTEGDEGARHLIRERPDLVIGVACEGDPSDIDTPEDLAPWS